MYGVARILREYEVARRNFANWHMKLGKRTIASTVIITFTAWMIDIQANENSAKRLYHRCDYTHLIHT